MGQSKVFSIGIFILSVFVVSDARAATREQLVEAAKKEGTIEFYAPSNLTPGGAQALADAFNKMYGLKITLNFSPAGNMAGVVSKLVGAASTGAPPEWDLMVVHDAAHATLWLRKLHQPFDYRRLGVDSKLIHYDNGTVSFANQFVLPGYNKQTLPPVDVPKKWEDLMDPKWKGGKLGMSTATHHLARLAPAWGEKKTTEFVKALASQQPYLGELGAIYTRLQLGEILVAITMVDSFVYRAKVTGAPVVFAEAIEPVISPTQNAGVLKGARHPNVGHLFAAFLTTLEAQEIWDKYVGQTSVFIPGTKAYKYAQGKKVVYTTQNHAEMVDRLAREYGNILGFR